MPRARLVFDGDWVYTEKEARIHKLTQETETKIDNIPGVVDDVNSTSTTDALSANMGKVLQDQINQLTGLNKFLSTWDCTTGLPVTDPSATPFTYTSGNYYLVATVAWEWGTNYKPHWSTFTPWVASTAVETNEVNVNDMYIFDWSQWILQVNKVKEIIVDDGLSPDSTNAVENRAIYSALTTKQDKLLDINDIRTGAALWATSLQPWDNITELTNNVGYQTAGDVAAAISQVAVDVNTKTFILSGLSWATALAEAQDIYDWYAAGKNPIVIYDNKTYVFSGTTNWLTFNEVDTKTINYDSGSNIVQKWIRFLDTAGEVTSIISWEANRWGFLALSSNYIEPYTPLYNWSPATKKYVDDSITSATEWNKYIWPTAPSNPTEWQLWYDTTNDVLKVYDWTQWNLTWKVYSSWTGISVDNTNDTISNTWVLSINGSTWTITWIATESYVDNAVDSSIHSWSSAPANPEVWTLWYDTVNNVLKVWNWTSWTSIQELLVNWVNIKTVNNHDLLWSWNIDIIWVEEIQFVTQAEYDALPSSKLSDSKAYFIYSWHGAAIVSDEPFWSTWDWITTQAPSKNAIYDVLGDVETLLANL